LYDTTQQQLAARVAALKQAPVPVEEYVQETAMPLTEHTAQHNGVKRKGSESEDNDAAKRQKVTHDASEGMTHGPAVPVHSDGARSDER
jgi:hypothetical protein